MWGQMTPEVFQVKAVCGQMGGQMTPEVFQVKAVCGQMGTNNPRGLANKKNKESAV